MPANNPCPRCGAQRPAATPAGPCPQCLLRLGLGADLSNRSRDGITRTIDCRPSAALTVLEASVGPVPRVILRDTEAGPETPVVRPGSDEVPDDPGVSDRYQLLGEIARGGMGAVLKGRDTNLGRDLAVKVLLEQHRNNPELVRRFIEEAQIGGQLQHPGIVPIYELGTFPDLRPYFAMKLVRGRTLAALLAARRDLADDRPRMLGVFEQVCQTVAYAHARGVIHRDLKPSNVMVGSFGEVQVMDWGLAKVLGAGGAVDDERSNQRSAESVIRTVRSGSAADASLAGSLLGTPAYMSPEQARGEIDSLDERVDVFGLGAILCEILTGQPPYVGRNSSDVQRLAARAELDDARARLDASRADTELLALARFCLAAEPKDRPRDAGEVALTMRQYLGGVQERLRRAELGRVEAQARAEEEAKRRKVTRALAASVLFTAAVVGTGWAWVSRERTIREAVTAREVNRALDDAGLLLGEARAAPADSTIQWVRAMASAKKAEALLARGEGAPGLRERVGTLLATVAREESAARHEREDRERDRRMVERLNEIYVVHGASYDSKRKDADYAAAFRDYGVDLDVLPSAEAGRRLAARPVAVALAGALDNWVFMRRSMAPLDRAVVARLMAVARVADPDPWRNRVRDSIDLKDEDRTRSLDALRGLARDADVQDLPLVSTHRLAQALWELGDRDTAIPLLRTVQQVHSGDFWVNSDLGTYLRQLGPASTGEAVRFLTAAVAIQPGSLAVRHKLADTLASLGRTDEAIVAYRQALRIDPASALLRTNLAQALLKKKAFDEALAVQNEAFRRSPGDPDLRLRFGRALANQGATDQALEVFREAVRVHPDHAHARASLASSLLRRGQRDEALAQVREARRLGSDAETHHLIAIVLREVGRLDEAIADWREAIRLRPDVGYYGNNLAHALELQGKLDEAAAACREAIRVDPGFAASHITLGSILRRKHEYAESLAEYRRGHDLGVKQPGWSLPSAEWVRQAERLAKLQSRLPAVLRGDDHPSSVAERLDLAQMAYANEYYGVSARLFGDALRESPDLAADRNAQHTYNAACAAALAAAGQGKDDPPPDDGARAALRQQALDWLRTEHTAWSKRLEDGQSRSRGMVRRALEHWKTDPDLASTRGAEALARLTVTEQEAWRALWVEVDSLLEKAR